jgi:rhodanese-related sulfurtransferase
MNKFHWPRDLTRTLLVVLLWGLVAAAVNTFSPYRIAWVGAWPSTFGTDTTAVPPSYGEGDPPILRLDEATALYHSAQVLFVDARDPEDYSAGHIRGAVNLPFDYYDDFAGDVLPQLGTDRPVVTYCGGTDCELSLYLARQLLNEGIPEVHIFFSGYSAWEDAGMPITSGLQP